MCATGRDKMDKDFLDNKYLCSTSTVTENDSILEFKSPKLQSYKPTLNELGNHCIKKTKKVTKFKNSVENCKDIKFKQFSEKQKKKSSHKSQPSIESSFFNNKSNDSKSDAINEKSALLCPLCFKMFKELNSQALHMKICAYKNNISTKKLLDAIELQKRQENERKSLGLPGAPIVQERKKIISHKINLHEESDLQLALALSKSLQEAEDVDEAKEIDQLPKTSELDSEMVEPIFKEQLEKFGFANSKPPLLVKSKKKKSNEITLLQTRSQRERNYILTEKISEIIMEDELPSQNKMKEVICNQDMKKVTTLRSRLLKRFLHKENDLWNKASLTSNQKCFYVPNLSEYIISEEKGKETENEIISKCISIYNLEDTSLNQYKTKVSNNEKIFSEISHKELCFLNEKCKNCPDKQFINTLVTDWGNTLNNSSTSDIIIFVNNNKHIWAHKLVFFVRCSNILLDITHNNNSLFPDINEKIDWVDVSHNVALAFLEFIYCGIIEKYCSVFEELINFSSLRNLARKYKVKQLFDYLKKKEIENKQNETEMHNKKNTEYEKEVTISKKNNLELNDSDLKNLICNTKNNFDLHEHKKLNGTCMEKCTINKSKSSEIELKGVVHTKQSSQKDIYSNNIGTKGYCNMSPDMFDDTISRNTIKGIDQSIGVEEPEENEDLINVFDSDRIHSEEDTNISNLVKTVNTISSTNNEKNINSVSNSLHSNELNGKNCFNTVKPKSNLSLFIEQFQKENAKSDLDIDSDSEVSVLSILPKANRNPFNVRNYDNSSQYSTPYKYTVVEKTVEKEKKGVLSMFDNYLVNPKLNTTILDDKNNTNVCFDVGPLQTIDGNVQNCIKRNTMSNSMNININNVEAEFQNEVVKPNMEDVQNIQNIATEKSSISKYNKSQNDSTVLNVDTDEEEISMYSKYKQEHKNNSILKYRDYVKKYVLTHDPEVSLEYSKCRKINNVDDDITILSNVNENSEIRSKSVKEYKSQTDKIELISNLKKRTQLLADNPCNLINEVYINDEGKNYFSLNFTSSINSKINVCEVQGTDSLKMLTCSKSENNTDTEEIKNLLTSSVQPDIHEYDFSKSSESIISSPELDFDISNLYKCQENKNNNTPNLKKSGDNNTFENNIYLSNIHINNSDVTTSFSLSPKEINQLKKSNSVQICNVNKEKSISTISNKNIELTASNNFSTGGLKRDTKFLIEEQTGRQCKKKFVSETDLNIDIKSVSNSSSRKFQCTCHRKIVKATSPVIITRSTTPPPNYDGMKTPELHAELDKYGLKTQKRKKAVKLLTYIYDELHPTITATSNIESEFTTISSEDEEPPMKKKNNKIDINSVNSYECEALLSLNSINSNRASVIITDEKKLFDEPESVITSDNTENIKDLLLKLITTNKEVYNKILAYEPLCINSIYSILKSEGFKCKINTIMDFLDEQCVTFYVKEMKRKKDKQV